MRITKLTKYKFRVYIDWWVTIKAWQLTNKPINERYYYTFKEFCTLRSSQTGKTFLDEWIWKFPERFK